MRKTGAPFRLGLLAGTYLVTNQDVPLADASPAVQVSTFGELAAAIEQTQPDQINLTGAGFDLERTLQVTAGKSISVTGTNAVLRCTDACFKVSGTSSVLQLSDIELQLGTGFQSTTHDVSATSFFTVETGGAVETTDVTFSPGVCAGWHFMQGKCISDASTEAVTWNEADTACRAVGANLVSIHSKDENLAMLSRVREGGHSSTWLGASFDPQDQLQWSDQSSSAGYKWPLVSSSSGDCVIMDATYGGMWARVPCSSTDDLHHYRCAIQVAAAPSIKQVIGDGVGFQHSNPTLFVENPTELVQAHGNTDIISTITTIRYRDVNDNVFNVPVTGTTPYTVQVRVTGTSLTNDMQVTLDTASAAGTTASTDGTIATFDLSVSGLPQNLHLKAGTTLASASKVEVVLQSQVVLSHQLDQEVACTTMAPLGTFNPFNANANNEITIDANQALSLAMTQSGCSVFTLWTPTGQVSPFQLELEGTDLNQLKVSDGSEIIDVPVSSDGIVELRYNNVGFVQPTFTISRSSASSSCIKNVAFKYHGEVIGSMSAKSLFDNCAEVCGAVYQQVDECLMFDSTDFLLETISFELLTTSVCDQLSQGIVSNQESLESICTYDGPFTPEILDEVFGTSDFSTFKFNSSLPESLELPSNALLAKNRELILDGDNQVANETLPLVVPWFEIEGSATLDYVHLTNGIKVSNGGFLSASLTTLSGVAELTAGGSARWNGGTVNLENVPSFTVGSDSTLYLAGTKIPTPSGVTQSSHIAQVTGSGKVSVTNLYLDNVAVEIANDMSKVEFASAQRSYVYTQCSNDPTAVPFSDLTFVANTNSFEECKSTCENAAQCSGIGLSTDESTGEIRCSHCLAQSCLIACDGPSGYYFEAKSGGGYVSLNGCFATILNNAGSIKNYEWSVSKRDTAVLECQARCEVYSKCASVRVGNTQSPFTCDLYEVDEVNTECGSPQEYHVKFAASGVDYVPVPYADLKVEPVAARSVGTYTSDECVEYCTIHEACNMAEYSGTTCTLLSHDNTLSAPWSSPSYSPDTEILVPTGDGFPRVFYEAVEQAFTLITGNSDFLEWNGRVAKVQACERKCSAFGYCVAFAFAEPSSLDDDDDNCFLYNDVGARNALAEESTNSFDLHLAVSSIKFDNVYVPFGTNCSEVEDYVDEAAGVHFENIDAIDSCGSICFMRSTCDMFEYSYQNATCTIYPNTNLTSSFACEHQNAIYDNNMHKFETASPLVTSVRYAKAKSGCLEYTLTTTQPASSTSSLEACKVMCDLHPECTAFFYSNGCELIHTLLAKQEDLCVPPNVREFYLSSHNPERDAYTQIPFDACFVVDRNHEGATIVNADDVSACRKACFEDYNCRAYSFDAARSEGEKCVLHDDATMEPGVDCNAELAFVETFEKYFVAASSAENVTVVGSEELLTTPNPVSLKECQALCDVFEACVAIAIDSSLSDGSFLDGESDCVLLKASADGAVGTATYSRINSTDLAVMNAYDPYLFTEVIERNVYPDPQKEIELSSALVVPRQSDCEAMCEVVAGCHSLTYDVTPTNYGSCKLYGRDNWNKEQSDYVDDSRPASLRYLISYSRFVNSKPQFSSISSYSNLHPTNEPYLVETNITTSTACQIRCLETKEQCEFARFFQDSNTCEMYGEGTKIDSEGVMGNICQTIAMKSSQVEVLQEVSVMDARGVVMFDQQASESSSAIDGSLDTTVSSSDWSVTLCTPRPIARIEFHGVSISHKAGVYASAPRDALDIGAFDETERFIGYANTIVAIDPLSFTDSMPANYVRRTHSCVGKVGHLSSLRPLLPSGCAKQCDAMDLCNAFNYDRLTGTCYFKNNAAPENTASCANLDAFVPVSSAPEAEFLGSTVVEGCTEIQIELDGAPAGSHWTKDGFLQLCEVQVFDADGKVMFDPGAASRTFSNTGSNTDVYRADKAVDGNDSGDLESPPYPCFHSPYIPTGETNVWSTSFCTPRPVRKVRVVTRINGVRYIIERINGARVYLRDSTTITQQLIAELYSSNGKRVWDIDVPDFEVDDTHVILPPRGCETIRVELPGSTTREWYTERFLQICELQVFDINGRQLHDPNAISRVRSSGYNNVMNEASLVLDNQIGVDGTVFGTCFHSSFIEKGKIGFWESTFCTSKPIAKVRLSTRLDGNQDVNIKNRLRGATVYKIHADGTRTIVNSIDTAELAHPVTEGLAAAPMQVALSSSNHPPGYSCRNIRIDLAKLRSDSFLQLCEVQVFDEDGVQMFDPDSINWARSSDIWGSNSPKTAVDGNPTQYLENNQCFHSNRVSVGEIGWWESRFCTPRPIRKVKVFTRNDGSESRINGATVHISNDNKNGKVIGTLIRDSGQTEWTLDVGSENSWAGPNCETVRVEMPRNKGAESYIQLCEVQLIDQDGNVMFDPTALNRISTSGYGTTDKTPETAVDNSIHTELNTAPFCFHSSLISYVGWWEATICTPKPAKSVRIYTRTDGSEGRLSGAIVSVRNSRGVRRQVGIVSSRTQRSWDFDIVARNQEMFCNMIRVELRKNTYLQLCDILFYDAAGSEMYDPLAGGRARISHPRYGYHPSAVFNFARNQELKQGHCFHSDLIQGSDTGWLESTVCTPRPVARINVKTRTDGSIERINGAVVVVTNQAGAVFSEQTISDASNSKADWDMQVAQEVDGYCDTIRVELGRHVGVESYLQICEVQPLDENGNPMFDPQASRRAIANSHAENSNLSPGKAADGDNRTDMNNGKNCFHSGLVAVRRTVYWETTFCTPKPASGFRIFTRTDGSNTVNTRINQARVFHTRHNQPTRFIGELLTESGKLNWVLHTPSQPTGSICQKVRVELQGKILQLCEVQLLNSAGEVLYDPMARERAVARTTSGNGLWNAATAADGDTHSNMETSPFCYHASSSFTGTNWWETTFCVNEAAKKVRIITRTDGYGSRINGARVFYQHLDHPVNDLGTISVDGNDQIDDVEIPDVSDRPFCQSVRIEHDNDFLQICEVEMIDENGNTMFDPMARYQVRASTPGNLYPLEASVDGNINTDMATDPHCYHSDTAWTGTAWWEATFCTEKPAHKVRIRTRTDESKSHNEKINNAKVFFHASNESVKYLGKVQTVNGAAVTFDVTGVNNDGYCRSIRIEMDVGKILELCEVQLLDDEGVPMYDSNAVHRLKASTEGSTYPLKASVDNNHNTILTQAPYCYHSQGDYAHWWEATFCTPRPAAEVLIKTRTDCCHGRILGARVYTASEGDTTVPLGQLRKINSVDKNFRVWKLPILARRKWEMEEVLQTGCSRVEIVSPSNLRICEVQVIDEEGTTMSDYLSQERATSVATGTATFMSQLARFAVDNDDSTCFEQHAHQGDNSEQGWRATFCTTNRIHAIRVKTDDATLVSDATVSLVELRSGKEVKHKLGNLASVPDQQLTTKWCTSVRIEQNEGGSLNLCEVQLLNSNGVALLDTTMSMKRASSSSSVSHPSLATDGNESKEASHCFDSGVIPSGKHGYWETTMCTAEPAASVRVLTSTNKGDVSKTNGAKVFISESNRDAPILFGVIEHRGTTSSEVLLRRADVQPNVYDCETVLFEQQSGTDPLRMCDVRIFDKEGREMFDPMAPQNAFSDSVLGNAHRPAAAVRVHLGSDTYADLDSKSCFLSKSKSGMRWLSVKFCVPKPIGSIQVSYRGTISQSNKGMKAYVVRSNGLKQYFGQVHATYPRLKDVAQQFGTAPKFLAFLQFQPVPSDNCETIRVETDRSTALEINHIALKDEFGGTILLDEHRYEVQASPSTSNTQAGFVLDSDNTKTYKSAMADAQFWEATFCPHRRIALVEFDAPSSFSDVKVYIINSFGVKHELFKESGSLFRYPVYPILTPMTRHNQVFPTLGLGDTFVSFEGPVGQPVRLCEIELLDDEGNVILETSLVSDIVGPTSTSELSWVYDMDLSTCYDSEFISQTSVPTVRFVVNTGSTKVNSVRIHPPVGGSFSPGTKVYITHARGMREVAVSVAPENQFHSAEIDKLGRDGKFLVPYSEVNFGQVAELKMQVGGTQVPMSFVHQSKDGCAALCSEWFQCLGFYTATNGDCTLKGGLTFGKGIASLHSKRRLQEGEGDDIITEFPTPSPSERPTFAPITMDPTTEPTATPTAPSASPSQQPTRSPTTPRPTTSPTATVFDADEYERSLGPFVSILPEDNLCLPQSDGVLLHAMPLEGCVEMCNRMSLCLGLTWNTEECHLITSRLGVTLRSCSNVDVGTIQLVALSRLLENTFRMESVGNVVPSDPSASSIVATEANTVHACENACLEASACKFSQFQIKPVATCRLFDSVGSNGLVNGNIANTASPLSSSSLKIQAGSYQRKVGYRMHEFAGSKLRTVYRKTAYGCIAICDLVKGCDAFNYDTVDRVCVLFGNIPVAETFGSDGNQQVFLQDASFEFYRNSHLLRKSLFGGPNDFARLSSPVLRSICESACKSAGVFCDTFVHTLNGECRLASFTSPSPTGVLVNRNGYCIAEGLPTRDKDQCLDVNWFFNYGNGDLGRIKNTDSGKCITRKFPELGTVANPETVLGSCSVTEIKNSFVYSYGWTWNGITFDNIQSDEPNDSDYPKFTICHDGVQSSDTCPNESWGLRTDENDPLEYIDVYVTPQALIDAQTVTNPDVLYFRWLYSSEGKTARSLMSKAKSLQLTAKDLENGLNKAVGFAKTAESLVRNINTPVEVFQKNVGRLGTFLSGIGFVLRIGDQIKYVKYVSKPLRWIFSKAGGKVAKGVANAAEKVKTTSKLLSPLNKMEYKLKEAISGVSNNVAAFTVLSGSLVALGFCASQNEIQEKIVIAEKKMKQTIAGMDKLVEIGNSVVGTSQHIGNAVSVVKQEVIGRLNAIQQKLKPVTQYLKHFDYLIDIFETKIEIDIPIYGKLKVTLLKLADVISTVFDFLKYLVFGVGALIIIGIEELLGVILSGIFGSIAIPLPGFDVSLVRIDQLKFRLEQEYNQMVAGVAQLLDVQELMPFDLDLFSFQDQLPSFDCDNAMNQCTINPAGFTFSADSINIPGIDIPDINFEQVGQVFTDLGDDFVSVFESIAAGGSAKCVEWGEPLTCDAILKQFGEFGESIMEEFAASGCSLNIPVCHRWEIPGLAAAQVAIQDLGKSIEEGLEPILGSNARRLSGEGTWAFEFPIVGPNTVLGTYFQSSFTRILEALFQLSQGLPLDLRIFTPKRNGIGFKVHQSPPLVTCVVDITGKASFKILTGQLNFHVWRTRISNSLYGYDSRWKSDLIKLEKKRLQQVLWVSVSTRVHKTTTSFRKSTIATICKQAPDYQFSECEGFFDRLRMQWKKGNKNSSGQLLKERGQILYSVLYWLVLVDDSYICDRVKVYEYFISGSMASPPCGNEAPFYEKAWQFARGIRMHWDKRKLFGSSLKYVGQRFLQTEGQELKQCKYSFVFSDPVHLRHGGNEVIGALTPFEYLHALRDRGRLILEQIKNQKKELLHNREKEYEIESRAGAEFSLPFGVVIHTSPQSCFRPGSCFDGVVCPILGTKFSYDVDKPDNSDCTCNGECLNSCIDGTCGLHQPSQIDNPATTDSPSVDSTVFIAVAFAIGGLVATVVVVRKRRMQKRLEKRGRFDSQAREYVRDGKIGVANPMFSGEEDVDDV